MKIYIAFMISLFALPVLSHSQSDVDGYERSMGKFKKLRQEESENKDEGYAYYKDPYAASMFSIIFPGGGQFYNEQNAKGGLFILGELLTLIVVAVGTEDNVDVLVRDYGGIIGEVKNESVDVDDDDYLIGIGFLSWLMVRGWSILDANKSAKKLNKLNGFEFFYFKPITSKNRIGAMFSYRF